MSQTRRGFLGAAAAAGAAGIVGTSGAGTATAATTMLAQDRGAGSLDVVAEFRGPMPTGVTVSRGGRIFVNFPKWDDPVTYTVAELMPDGRTRAFPSIALNTAAGRRRTAWSRCRASWSTPPTGCGSWTRAASTSDRRRTAARS